MNKNDFRSLCNIVNPGDILTLTAVDTLRAVEAVVNSVSTGRGRGGSKLLRVTLANGESRQYSSSHSNHLVCVNHGGRLFGSNSESNVFGPNQNATSAQMREIGTQVNNAFKNALALKNTGHTVDMYFNVPDNHTLFGDWQVYSGRLVRGRGGQVALTLINADCRTVEVWSRRLVGEVESVKYVDDTGYTELINCRAA